MPATTSPPGVPAGCSDAASTRHSASSQVVRQTEDVRGLARGVHGGHRGAVERGHQNLMAPSGSSTPGKILAPLAITLSAPIVTPSPSTDSPVDVRVVADPHAAADDAAAERAVRADLRAAHDDGALDRRVRARP